MDRRAFMQTTAGAAIAGTLPAAPTIAITAKPLSATPMWAVGTDCGEFNWVAIRAPTMDEARQQYAAENGYILCRACECEAEGCECGMMADLHVPDFICAERQSAWDDLDTIKSGDWIDGDLGYACDRCGEDCYGEFGAYSINRKAVCEDCMTLEDWQIADPVRHAEMLADAEPSATPPLQRGEG